MKVPGKPKFDNINIKYNIEKTGIKTTKDP